MAVVSLAIFALGAGLARAAVYHVGAGGAYPTFQSLPRLAPGDVVEVAPGTYHEYVRWTASGTVAQPITLRGTGLVTIDGAGLVVTGAGPVPRALFQIEGDHYRIEHLHFTHAANGENGAGIRVTGHARDTVVRDCQIDHNEMGMMSDGNDDLLIEFCDIGFNGNSIHFAGYAHNLYLAGRNTTIRFCNIHDADGGMNVKSRGHFLALLYNRIVDSDGGELSLVDSDETAVPNSNVVLIGNLIRSKPDRKGNTHKFIDFGQESGHRVGMLTMINNTLLAGDGRIEFVSLSSPDVRVTAYDNRFAGSLNIIVHGEGRVTGGGNDAPPGPHLPALFTSRLDGADASSALRYRDGAGRWQDGIPRFEFTPGARQVEQATRRSDTSAPTPGAFAGTVPAGL